MRTVRALRATQERVLRAAIYVRISQDRAGEGHGVARQTEDCQALCDRRGWTVIDVYSDNDLGAYAGKPRPAWERLIGDIEAGHVDVVVCWHPDRLTRQPMELEMIINLVERKGVDLATVTAGEVDLSTATGRAAARIVGAMARHESEQKAERLRRQKQQAAEKGLVSGGGHRAFGYERDGLTIREPEAELIREAADRVLAGETIASVCRDFEARDVRTTAGNWWKPLTLRQMLCSARISGRREHRPGKSSTAIIGEIVADAVWPGIIGAADSDELRAQLGRTGTGRITGATGRVYLLSGILRCGICTGRISGHNTGRGRRYYCPGAPGSTSCGRLTMGMDRTDIHIRDTVLLALESPEFRERLHRRAKVDPAIRTSVKNDERLLGELDEDRTAGRISRARWLQMADTVTARLETNRRKLAAVPSLRALEGLDGSYEEMLAVWEARNVSQRRAIATACVSHIIVNRAARRGPVFDPDRFDPQWLV